LYTLLEERAAAKKFYDDIFKAQLVREHMHDDRLMAERKVPAAGNKKLIMTEYLKLRKFAMNKLLEGRTKIDNEAAGLTTYSTEKII